MSSLGGSVKLTHIATGNVLHKTPEQADKITKAFKGSYKVEPQQVVADPPELTEEKSKGKAKANISGAAADQPADDSTK